MVSTITCSLEWDRMVEWWVQSHYQWQTIMAHSLQGHSYCVGYSWCDTIAMYQMLSVMVGAMCSICDRMREESYIVPISWYSWSLLFGWNLFSIFKINNKVLLKWVLQNYRQVTHTHILVVKLWCYLVQEFTKFYFSSILVLLRLWSQQSIADDFWSSRGQTLTSSRQSRLYVWCLLFCLTSWSFLSTDSFRMSP